MCFFSFSFGGFQNKCAAVMLSFECELLFSIEFILTELPPNAMTLKCLFILAFSLSISKSPKV